jgi:hypothetical protein
MRLSLPRLGVLAALCLSLAVGAGCGSDDGGESGAGNTTRSSPNTEGALLTVLNYGRAAQASEVCPLLSADYAKEIGGGDAKRCGTAGEDILCPCVPARLNTSSLSVNGDTATAVVSRPTGGDLTITLVLENNVWKIDKLDPPKAA